MEWDISLKAQLEDFARGSRFISSNIPEKPYSHSPYGSWDVLWLGHCGAQQDPDDTRRFVLRNDPTVPPPTHLGSGYEYQPDMDRFDNNTRLVYRSRLARCHHAAGISYSGAQRILATMAQIQPLLSGNSHDAGMSLMCEKGDLRCIASHPSLMSKVRNRENLIPDNRDGQVGYTVEDRTPPGSIARGVQHNLVKLVRGEGHDIKVPWQMPVLEGPLEREYLYQ